MSKFTKVEERYHINHHRSGDHMTLTVFKNTEVDDHYKIEEMELQMWQSRKQLVEWLRWCADRIEKDLP